MPVTGDALRDIGGAIVRRRFTHGGRELTNGMTLLAEEVTSMPRSNFRALQDNGYIQVFPKAVKSHLQVEDVGAAPVERKMVWRHGTTLYDVVEGKVINTTPLTKKQAEILCKQGEAVQEANPAPTAPAVAEDTQPSL